MSYEATAYRIHRFAENLIYLRVSSTKLQLLLCSLQQKLKSFLDTCLSPRPDFSAVHVPTSCIESSTEVSCVFKISGLGGGWHGVHKLGFPLDPGFLFLLSDFLKIP